MTDKQEYKQWEQFRLNLVKETVVEHEEPYEKLQRIERLEANHEAWFKYYFPNYYTSEPAKFHKDSTNRVMDNSDWYEVRPWSRELAKSARTMMEFLKLSLTGKIRNTLLISATVDSAENILQPYKINLESNLRIINDYGEQKGLFQWTDGNFKSKGGFSFMAVGAGQSPRGTRNEEVRPDALIFDDIDTDEEVLKKSRIKKKWDWIEQAVMPTISVSKGARIVFCGNIIGKDTCITRAMKFADIYKIVNIRNRLGKSSWKKNSEEQIDRMLSKISTASGQKEYFNNPISEGDVFKDMCWEKVPSLKKFKTLVVYGDPSPSNSENKKSSMKAVFLLGKLDGFLYVITGFLDQITNDKFVNWFYILNEYVNSSNSLYHYIENNSLQNPFYQQVIIPLFDRHEKDKYKIPVKGDNRKKPEKFARIESNLEPLHNQGRLILNVAEKTNPHMLRLEEQFLGLNAELSFPSDGPDCIEGGSWVLDKKAGKSGRIIGSTNRISKNRI